MFYIRVSKLFSSGLLKRYKQSYGSLQQDYSKKYHSKHLRIFFALYQQLQNILSKFQNYHLTHLRLFLLFISNSRISSVVSSYDIMAPVWLFYCSWPPRGPIGPLWEAFIRFNSFLCI